MKKHDLTTEEIHINAAYLRLYKAAKDGQPFEPASHFGSEIEVILHLEHAEDLGRGYRITESGIAHWEHHVKAWRIATGTDYGGRVSATSATSRLLSWLSDGQWKPITAFPDDIAPATGYQLVRSDLAVARGKSYRISPTGWARLVALQLVDTADEPQWEEEYSDAS